MGHFDPGRNASSLLFFCSDQVFRITPANDEEVQVLQKILAHMKVCSSFLKLFLLLYTHIQMLTTIYSFVIYIFWIQASDILSHSRHTVFWMVFTSMKCDIKRVISVCILLTPDRSSPAVFLWHLDSSHRGSEV